MTNSDFQFKKDHFGNDFVTFAEGITKTRQIGLHEKHRLIQSKMFLIDTSRCPVNIFKLYLSKRPSQLCSSGPLYLSIIHKSVSNSLLYKNVPIGQHTINSIMKRMIKFRPKINKQLSRKTQVKILRQNYIPKSKIIGITGHNSEAGLDAYDSGNEEQKCAISSVIDTNNKVPVNFQQSQSKPWVILQNDE